MKLQLESSLSSPQDIKAIVVEVRRYARWFAQESIKARVSGTATKEPLVIAEPAAVMINQAADGKPLNNKVLEELIVSLESILSTSPHITITLAGVPSGSLKKKITEWCRKTISPGVLVDFKFNATILGGMVVQYGSHVYDWSFRRQILNNRAKFPEVLRHV